MSFTEYVKVLQDLTVELQGLKLLLRVPDPETADTIAHLKHELAESERLRESEHALHVSYVKSRQYEREVLMTHNYNRELLIEELVSMSPNNYDIARAKVAAKAQSSPSTRRESMIPSGSDGGSPLQFELNDLLSLSTHRSLSGSPGLISVQGSGAASPSIIRQYTEN